MFQRVLYAFLSISLILGAKTVAANESAPLNMSDFEGLHILASPEERKKLLKKWKPSAITPQHSQFLFQQLAGQDIGLEMGLGHLQGLSQKEIKAIKTGKAQVSDFQTSYMKKALQQTRHFPAEALVFYSAIGATMAFQAFSESKLADGRTDPRWLNNLAYELSSPVGVFSFYMFLMASGATGRAYAKGLNLEKKLMASRKAVRASIIPGSVSASALLKHQRLQKRMRWHNTIAGQLGLAAGIMASNIVTELYYITERPAWDHCVNEFGRKTFLNTQTLTDSNQNLECDSFFDEFTDTTRAWTPALLSVLSASMLSSMTMRGIQGGFMGSKALLFRHGPEALKPLLAKTPWFRIPQWIIKFSNLFLFMEIEQQFTHKIFDPLMNEPWTFADLTNSMEDFSKTYKTLNHIPEENCSDCPYHPLVKSAHKTAQQFSQWRQYKSLIPSMAYNNWLLHINNALGTSAAARNIYTEFFKPKEQNSLTQEHYLVPSDSSPETAPRLSLESMANQQPETLQTLTSVLEEIKKYKEDNNWLCENKEQQIVSPIFSLSAVSPFIDPLASAHLWSYEKKLCTLESLFSALSPSVQLELFYKNTDLAQNTAQTAIKEDFFSYIKDQDWADQIAAEFNRKWDNMTSYEKEEWEDKIQKTVEENWENYKSQYTGEEWENLISSALEQNGGYEDLDIPLEDLRTMAGTGIELQIKEELKTQTEHEAIYLSVKTEMDLWEAQQIQKLKEDLLRKRVLSAGLDLLNHTAENAKLSNQNNRFRNKGAGAEVMNHKEFIIQLNNKVKHIKSFDQGMFYIATRNQFYKDKEEIDGFNYHSKFFGSAGFHTPEMMDFMAVSFVCGHGKDELFNNVSLNKDSIMKAHTEDQHWNEVVAENLPAFQRHLIGTDYSFNPPRVPALNISEEERKAICKTGINGLVARQKTKKAFQINGKTYHHLLHLIVDNIDAENLKKSINWVQIKNDMLKALEEEKASYQDPSSYEDMREHLTNINIEEWAENLSPEQIFEQWWNLNVDPYISTFLELSDKEFQKMVEYQFPGPFFQNTMKTAHLDLETPDQLVNIPSGIFPNIHFEMNYWTDIIKNTLKEKNNNPEIHKELENQLKELIGLYDVDKLNRENTTTFEPAFHEGSDMPLYNSELALPSPDLDLSKRFCSVQGNPVKNFFRPAQVSSQCKKYYEVFAWGENTGQEMCKRQNQLKLVSQTIGIDIDELNQRRYTGTMDQKISFFKENSENDVLEQVLKFSLIRLNDLMQEFQQNINMRWPEQSGDYVESRHIFTSGQENFDPCDPNLL